MSDASTTHSPGRREAPQRPEKISSQLSVPQLVGGAAAAVTSAVVGSRLGTTGTILGAALGSVVVGVASTVYTTGLRWTRHGFRVAAQQIGSRRGGGATATTADVDDKAPRRLGPVLRRGLLAAVLIFVVGIGALTIFEQATGHAVGGGSQPSVVQFTRTGSSGGGSATGSGSSSASATPSSEASDASSSEATSSASASATATDTSTSQASDEASSAATDQATSQATDQATSGSDQATSGSTSEAQTGSTSEATSGTVHGADTSDTSGSGTTNDSGSGTTSGS